MMDIRRVQVILFAAILLLAGCQKERSAGNTPSSPPSDSNPSPTMQTVASVHWLGIKRLSSETNAARLAAVWNLPESQKLKQQTLDKLSLAPWRLTQRAMDTNAAALLRPLLDDIVSNESCLEIRSATNRPGELVFAIRLGDRRAALWQTNLARVLKSLTGIRPVPAPRNGYSWSLKKHRIPDFIELTRAREWTLVGAAENHNGLLDELRTRIQHGETLVTTENTNDCLVANADLCQVAGALALEWNLPQDTPKLSLAVTGDGTNVLLHGAADFPQPLTLNLKPWNLPTNLISEQLCSFTMIRGFKSWLESSKFWEDIQIGPAPDQIYFWAEPGLGMLSYFAAPLPDAGNEVDRLTDWVLKNQYRWFPTNGLAKFGRSKAFNGLKWEGLPYMSPFLRSITVNHQNFIFAGGMPGASAGPSLLASLSAVLGRTDLLCHDWEVTGPRVEQWIYMGQFARFVSHKAQLPTSSPGLLWLKAIAPKLGVTVTDIIQTTPDRLSFTRRATIGLTAAELNLLADWLESPQFPRGLHTFLAPPSQP